MLKSSVLYHCHILNNFFKWRSEGGDIFALTINMMMINVPSFPNCDYPRHNTRGALNHNSSNGKPLTGKVIRRDEGGNSWVTNALNRPQEKLIFFPFSRVNWRFCLSQCEWTWTWTVIPLIKKLVWLARLYLSPTWLNIPILFWGAE